MRAAPAVRPPPKERPPMSITVRHPIPLVAAAFAWLVLYTSPAPAQNAEGMFVTVPNPITTEAVTRIKAQVGPRIDPGALQRVTTVVFDFNPDGKPAATPDFGAALSLQDYIKTVNGANVTT